jgi:hypothetical protein
MIRNSLIALALLASVSAHAAPNVSAQEAMVLDLVRSSILDEADSMHTQVKKGATQVATLNDDSGVIGYQLTITVEGYSYEKGNYEETYVVNTTVDGGVTKIVRK